MKRKKEPGEKDYKMKKEISIWRLIEELEKIPDYQTKTIFIENINIYEKNIKDFKHLGIIDIDIRCYVPDDAWMDEKNQNLNYSFNECIKNEKD